MLRIAILASGSGSNAEAIVKAVEDGRLDAQVSVILTNKPEAGVVGRAVRLGVPVEVVPSKGHRNRDAYDRLVMERLSGYEVDTIALAGWMRILSEAFVERWGGRILNIHPAILPSFKGGTGLQDALDYGVRLAGCTVHVVTPHLDAGPIVIQAAMPTSGTSEEVEARLHKLENLIFPQALQWYAQGRLKVEENKVIVKQTDRDCRRVDYVEGSLISPPLEY